MRWFPSCHTSSINMCGLNMKVICSTSSTVITLDTLYSIYLFLWTRRGCRGHRVYRKVFGKWAVGFWREGARRRLGGGVSLNLPSSLAPSFDTTGRRVSDRLCERGTHPQGWTLNPDFWGRDQNFKLHIWGLKEIERGGGRKWFSKTERKLERRVVKEQKDGCHETHAASPPADCAHAYKDGKGRINIWDDVCDERLLGGLILIGAMGYKKKCWHVLKYLIGCTFPFFVEWVEYIHTRYAGAKIVT